MLYTWIYLKIIFGGEIWMSPQPAVLNMKDHHLLWRQADIVKRSRVDEWHEIDGPTFVSKVAIFSNLGQGLPQKDSFFFIFDSNLEDGFFRQNVSNKKSTFVLVYGFLTVVFSQFRPNIVWKVAFSLKRYLKLSLSLYLMLNYANL